jgi:hypothetical protein
MKSEQIKAAIAAASQATFGRTPQRKDDTITISVVVDLEVSVSTNEGYVDDITGARYAASHEITGFELAKPNEFIKELQNAVDAELGDGERESAAVVRYDNREK